MKLFAIVSIVLLAACSSKSDAPATQTTIIISGPETSARTPIDVRRFEITPETARPGQPVTASVELAAAHPSRKLAVEWYGPDGWLVAYAVHDAGNTRFTSKAPVDIFDAEGRYEAVLRAGIVPLAEDSISIGG